MDVNESMNKYLFRIKDFQDNLADIGEEVSSIDLVSITLKGLLLDYEVFISALATRHTLPTFTELGRILIQEEERIKIYESGSQTTD